MPKSDLAFNGGGKLGRRYDLVQIDTRLLASAGWDSRYGSRLWLAIEQMGGPEGKHYGKLRTEMTLDEAEKLGKAVLDVVRRQRESDEKRRSEEGAMKKG